MSKKGIEIFVDCLTKMQNCRFALLQSDLAPHTEDYKQDVLLARLLERANDIIKDDFARIIDGKYPRPFPDNSSWMRPRT